MKIGMFFDHWWELDDKFDDLFLVQKEMEHFFRYRHYTDKVKKITIGVTCVPNPFKKSSRPWYYEDFKTNRTPTKETHHLYRVLDLEILLDFDACSRASIEGFRNIFARTLMSYLEEINYPLKIRKEFDKERFNRDMRKFLTERIGCKFE